MTGLALCPFGRMVVNLSTLETVPPGSYRSTPAHHPCQIDHRPPIPGGGDHV